MKKFLALLISVIMVLSMFSVMALPSFADEEEEEIKPGEWLADHIQSVDGDWLTRRGPGHLGKEDEYTPAGGYYYDGEGFHTTSPNYTNMTPSYAVISKETYNMKEGFDMTFRVDDFSYKGENGQADEWIAITIGDNQLLTPGLAVYGYGSGWVSLNRGTGNGSVSNESFWSEEQTEEGTGGAFAHKGTTSSTCAMDDDKEIYNLNVSWDGSAYTIKINDVTIAGNAQISENLDELNSDGDFYVSIVFLSGVTNGTAAITITDVNGSTPTGTDNVPAEENTLVYGDPIDPTTVPANQPALLYDANKTCFKSDPDMQNCEVVPNGDGSYTITSIATASFLSWNVLNSITYNSEDFPIFCMMVKNLDGASGIFYALSGDNLSAGPACQLTWDMYDYDDEKYEREWTDADDNFWNMIVVDLGSEEVTIENSEGRIHGCRIDFSGLDASGEYPFDLMYMGYFRSEDECQAYAESYLAKAGVIEGDDEPATEPDAEPATEPDAEPATGDAEPATEPATGDAEPATDDKTPVATEPATELATEPATDDKTPVATEPAIGDAEPATGEDESKADATEAATKADATTAGATETDTAVAEEEGCSSVIGAGAAALVLSAMAAAVALKKKH